MSVSAQDNSEEQPSASVAVEWQPCQIEVINDNTNMRAAPSTSADENVVQVDAGEIFEAAGYLETTEGYLWLVVPDVNTGTTLTGRPITRVNFQYLRIDTVTFVGDSECLSLMGQFVHFNGRYYTCPEDWCIQFSDSQNERFSDAIAYCFVHIIFESLNCDNTPEVQLCDDSHIVEAYGDITWEIRFWTCDGEVDVIEITSREEFIWGDLVEFNKCYVGLSNLVCQISDAHNQNRRAHFTGNRTEQLDIANRGLVPVEEVYFMDTGFEEAGDWTAAHPEDATPYFSESNICYIGSTIPPTFFTRMVCYEGDIEVLNSTDVFEDLNLDAYTVPEQWAFRNGFMFVNVVIEDENSDPRESNIYWVNFTPDQFEACYRADFGSVYVVDEDTTYFISGYNTSHDCEEIGDAGDFLFGNE